MPKTRKTSKKVRRRSYRKKRSTIKKYKKHRNSLAKGAETDQVQCCMCDKEISRIDGLVPAKCLAKNGANRGHRICQECWWSKFAKEGVNHSCPGCVKGLPLNGKPISNSGVIDLTEDD